MVYSTGYLVLSCGCTDCFPSAMFFNLHDAMEWGNSNACNPEGYTIKQIDISSLAISDD
jgi:hypothetical protein